jgi:TPR repeat protein
LKQAKGWYERAAKQDHAEAIARLNELARDNPATFEETRYHSQKLEDKTVLSCEGSGALIAIVLLGCYLISADL